ncbi:hypothetical protein MBH78_15990 [Oceanimonas sp. NS1]|nr:hypothetical protein [Oceanimonas sp. NS1]
MPEARNDACDPADIALAGDLQDSGAWDAGEQAAGQVLARFCAEHLLDYGEQRDFPAVAGTSRLSPIWPWGYCPPISAWRQSRTSSAACPWGGESAALPG